MISRLDVDFGALCEYFCDSLSSNDEPNQTNSALNNDLTLPFIRKGSIRTKLINFLHTLCPRVMTLIFQRLRNVSHF
jgi:hypothetical protein